MNLRWPSNNNNNNGEDLSIKRFHRRVLPDHPYTHRHQIVTNIWKGGKCPFLCDFPTQTITENGVRVQQEQERDVVLMQGLICSKSVLLHYMGVEGTKRNHSGYFANPTGNGKTFSMADACFAKSRVTGKELLEYAMRCSGVEANTNIFRHEVQIILRQDLEISVEEEKEYSLFWYVSQLERASTKVEERANSFNSRIQTPQRDNRMVATTNTVKKEPWELMFDLVLSYLIIFLPAILVCLHWMPPTMDDYKVEEEEDEQDIMAAKEELRSKNKELLQSNTKNQMLEWTICKHESTIEELKAKIDALEKEQKELVKECKDLVHEREELRRARKADDESVASTLQTNLAWFQNLKMGS